MPHASDSFRALFAVETAPKTDPRCVIIRGRLRITLLTPRLLRLETVKNGAFCDALIAPVQAAIARDISDWLANLGGLPVFGEEEVSKMKKTL